METDVVLDQTLILRMKRKMEGIRIGDQAGDEDKERPGPHLRRIDALVSPKNRLGQFLVQKRIIGRQRVTRRTTDRRLLGRVTFGRFLFLFVQFLGQDRPPPYHVL